jgi:hypothetical protein
MYNLLNGMGKKEKFSHIHSKTINTNAPLFSADSFTSINAVHYQRLKNNFQFYDAAGFTDQYQNCINPCYKLLHLSSNSYNMHYKLEMEIQRTVNY